MELPRHEQRAIEESLTAFPVVLLTGARQVGKTTLARRIALGPWRARYRTLDDPVVREAVRTDPDGFLAAEGTPLVVDEVQAAPDLLRAIKFRVDRERAPGQYLLTGSANVLALRRVTESLRLPTIGGFWAGSFFTLGGGGSSAGSVTGRGDAESQGL